MKPNTSHYDIVSTKMSEISFAGGDAYKQVWKQPTDWQSY